MNLTTGDEFGKIREYSVRSRDVGHGEIVDSFDSHAQHGAFPVFPAHGQPSGDGNKKSHEDIEIRPGSLKKHDYDSRSTSLSDLSLELGSESSWAKTDATPNTTVSADSRKSRKENKSQKGSKENSYKQDRIERSVIPYAPEIGRPVYHEHRRQEHRYSSISPARGPRDDVRFDQVPPWNPLVLGVDPHGPRAPSLEYSYGTRYRDHEHYEIEPTVSHPTDRAPRYRQSSVSAERGEDERMERRMRMSERYEAEGRHRMRETMTEMERRDMERMREMESMRQM